MAGTFTHLSVINSLRDGRELNSIGGLSDDIKRCLMQKLNYCDLGAVSPDYPYLTKLSSSAQGWANVMHYWKTADFIRNGVRLLESVPQAEKNRCIAWLFGYAAHVIVDLTVHPIVQKKVGPYEQYAREHRVCEMNQDVYIFEKWLGEHIINAEFIRRCGIATCTDPVNPKMLDSAIVKFWTQILGLVNRQAVRFHNDEIAKPTEDPSPAIWHVCFITAVDKGAEEGKRFWMLSRHAEDYGLTYPETPKLNYIENLKTEDGRQIDFDEVFERARQNVKATWRELGAAIAAKNPNLLTLPNANLDTGRSVPDGKLLFWEESK